MKKFEQITKIEDNSDMHLFSIEDHNGTKYIHVFGCLWADSGRICLDEYVWLMEPLADFVKHNTTEYVEKAAEEVNQNGDYDLEEGVAVKCVNTYFDGNPADYWLNFEEITLDTPVGNYVA